MVQATRRAGSANAGGKQQWRSRSHGSRQCGVLSASQRADCSSSTIAQGASTGHRPGTGLKSGRVQEGSLAEGYSPACPPRPACPAVDDIDKAIAKLEERVNHSTLTLNEEKRILDDIKKLKQSRATVGQISEKAAQLAQVLLGGVSGRWCGF